MASSNVIQQKVSHLYNSGFDVISHECDKRRGFEISRVNSCYHETFHGERKRRKSIELPMGL